MAIISFDKDAITDYVPKHGDNRYSEEPCIVRLKFVPYSRVKHYARVLSARTKNITKQEKMTEIAQEVQYKQFSENVEGIKNYFVGDREVTEPDEFYDTADTDLIVEIIRAMESSTKLSEGQLKNFQRVSDSTSKKTAALSSVKIAPIET